MIQKIISGGQTGADRAALDVALSFGFEVGGWVPKGRLAEDGVIPSRYPNLVETESKHLKARTKLNVRDSDATVIVSHGPLLGGSAYTQVKAIELDKPHLHLDLEKLTAAEAVNRLHEWLAQINPVVLNVAGPRASKDAHIYEKTKAILALLLRDVKACCKNLPKEP